MFNLWCASIIPCFEFLCTHLPGTCMFPFIVFQWILLKFACLLVIQPTIIKDSWIAWSVIPVKRETMLRQTLWITRCNAYLLRWSNKYFNQNTESLHRNTPMCEHTTSILRSLSNSKSNSLPKNRKTAHFLLFYQLTSPDISDYPLLTIPQKYESIFIKMAIWYIWG